MPKVNNPEFSLQRLVTVLGVAAVAAFALRCSGTIKSLESPRKSEDPIPSTSTIPVQRAPVLSDSKSGNLSDVTFAPLCSSVAQTERPKLLKALQDLTLGSRSMTQQDLGSSHDTCVMGLLPAALYTNIKTGVPASILIAQAVQETGWCTSELSKRGLNFHGQKVRFDASRFKYWKGKSIWIDSSEDPRGSGGNKVRSEFMAFEHPDHSFYSVAERFLIAELPYRKCLPLRDRSTEFARCIGQFWAVHEGYSDAVLAHRSNYRNGSLPSFRLDKCDLAKSEWELDPQFR